ncbi:MAG: sugar ABC transporter ATP-binding protein [Verrucomicrobia bacterium]|nr:sugar ABC transporter ATP-binding protein [Verrucomicrobiota bacterium]
MVTMSETENIWLRLTDISKHFGAVIALEGLDVAIRLGEVLALVGDNGAGKSTLVKLLSGAYPSSAGEITIGGAVATIETPSKARQLGIATIFQELALIENLTVYENIFLGREMVRPILGLPILDRKKMRNRVMELIDELGSHIPSSGALVSELSGGQRQAVAIARAIDLETKLVIMDEPTAALAVAETRKVLKLIEQLRDNGKAVLLVSHNLNDVFQVSDRIVVLRRGRKVAECAKSETDVEEVVSWITGGKPGPQMRNPVTKRPKERD